MLWAVEVEELARAHIADYREYNRDVEAIHTEILFLRGSDNRLPVRGEIEPYEDGFYLWHIHNHTILLQQTVEPINGETKTTTHVHVITISDAIRGEEGVQFLRKCLTYS